MIQKIDSPHVPAAVGPYSSATIANGTVYVSGQLPIDVNTGAFPGDDVQSQTKQSLENIKSILQAAGLTMKDVCKTTVYLQDIKDFGAMNEVYATYFTEPYPARAAFQVAALPKGAKVEIEAIAAR